MTQSFKGGALRNAAARRLAGKGGGSGQSGSGNSSGTGGGEYTPGPGTKIIANRTGQRHNTPVYRGKPGGNAPGHTPPYNRYFKRGGR
jgi:hypothetical protein